MTYERFEDLPLWRTAADLAATIYAWTAQPAFTRKGDLANQMQRGDAFHFEQHCGRIRAGNNK
jgi:hypothetical protein